MEPTLLHVLIRMVLMLMAIGGLAIAIAVVAWFLPRGPSRHHQRMTLLEQRRRAWGKTPTTPDDSKDPGRVIHEGGWRR